MCASGPRGFWNVASKGSTIALDAAASRSFPPEVAMYVVKIACERPDKLERSLSQWDCTEIGRQLVRDGVVTKISPETVRRILRNHRLKPWRQKMWLSAKVPRDPAFAAQVQEICDLYTRPLPDDEMVLCVDEMTSVQPRPRKSPTLATKPNQPTRVEHEYGRCGALNLFAAFDTRTGKVYGQTAGRKRQAGANRWPQAASGIHRVLGVSRQGDPCVGQDDPDRSGQPEDAQGQAGTGLAGRAPAVCLSSSASALFVDEPSGAVVQHPPEEAAEDRGFPQQGETSVSAHNSCNEF